MKWWLWAALAAVAASSGCTASTVVGKTAEGAEIVQVTLPMSNAFVIKSRPAILIDTGSDGDMPALRAALAGQGIALKDLGLVVVTHGHFDHAGLAAELKQSSSAKIIVGAGDAALVTGGHNDELLPTNGTADVLKVVLPHSYPAFQPDVLVNDRFDLSSYGVAGQVLSMPGHTAGSLVVVLDNHTAFVGDQMLGGALGGALCPTSVGEHYFQADVRRNHRNIRALLAMGIETFYLGHGGPAKRAAVEVEFQ